jgi:serine/threonine protein kinase
MLHSENRRITPKVIDLGVGKSIEEATVTANESATDSVTAASKDGVLQLTKFGRAVGTPAYMAPEQQRGEATVSSDVYGLGGILCTLLTGKTTIDYKADSHIQDDLPKDLRAILDKCLAEDPKLRYATPLELQADLQAWLRKGEVQAYIATMGPGSLIRYRSQRKVEALVRAVKTHPYVSGSILVAALGGSFVAKNHYERVEAQRVADVQAEKDRTELANILFNAKVRLSLMQDEEIQIDNSNNVPSSIDLLTSLSRFKSSP